jgi:hypothetical protein
MKIIEKKRTLFIVLQGRLGNQLFIYFAAKFFEERYNKRVVFISYLPNRLSEVGIKSNNTIYVLPKYLFMILNVFLSKMSLLKSTKKYIFFCGNIGYENLDDKISRLKFLNGHFQTNYYIENCSISDLIIIDIKSHFQANCVLSSNFTFENAIALHIRRGDYLLPKNNYFGLLSYDYYFSSLKKLCISGEYKRVYLFSDSTISQEFKDKFKIDFENLELIDTTKRNIDDICTLAVLSHFSAHTISNSTFSWWGAYLSDKSKIVIAPSIWFKDHLDPQKIYPVAWELIESAWE